MLLVSNGRQSWTVGLASTRHRRVGRSRWLLCLVRSKVRCSVPAGRASLLALPPPGLCQPDARCRVVAAIEVAQIVVGRRLSVRRGNPAAVVCLWGQACGTSFRGDSGARELQRCCQLPPVPGDRLRSICPLEGFLGCSAGWLKVNLVSVKPTFVRAFKRAPGRVRWRAYGAIKHPLRAANELDELS